MNEMNLLLEAREIIRAQPMTLRIAHLRTCADQLDAAYDRLKLSCTRGAITMFVGAASRTMIAIEQVRAHTPPTPTGGRMRQEQTVEEKTVTTAC